MNKEIEKLSSTITNVAANLKQALRVAFEKMQDVQGNNYRLGLTHLERGNLSDAVFRFTMVTRLSPKHADAWVKLADAQLQKGNVDKAKQALVTAKKLQPNHPDIPELIERFNPPAPAPEQPATE